MTLPAEDLRHLLATILAGATGLSEADWEPLLGDIGRLSFTRNMRSNWSIAPTSKCRLIDRIAIIRAVELVKAEHPYVRW